MQKYIIIGIIIILLFALYFYNSSFLYSVRKKLRKKNRGKSLTKFISYIAPSKESWLHKKYLRLAGLRTSVETIFLLKYICVVIAMILIVSVKYTNIVRINEKYYNSDAVVLENYEFQYEREQSEIEKIKKESFALSIQLMKENGEVNNQKFESYDPGFIKRFIHTSLVQLEVPRNYSYETIKVSVYNRMLDYYKTLKFNYMIYVAMIVASSFIPDIVFIILSAGVAEKKQKELIRLNSLLALEASFSNATFTSVIRRLSERAYFYKGTFERIIKFNQSNKKSNDQEFEKLIKSCQTEQEELFFQRLQTASHQNFEALLSFIKTNVRTEDQKDEIRYGKANKEMTEIFELYNMVISTIISLLFMIPFIQYFFDTELGF